MSFSKKKKKKTKCPNFQRGEEILDQDFLHFKACQFCLFHGLSFIF